MPQSDLTVPIEYAGKWIAWDHAMTQIVASGTSLAEVLKSAKEAGELDPVLSKSPAANVRMIGAGPLCSRRLVSRNSSGEL